jgi:hypothetical protein
MIKKFNNNVVLPKQFHESANVRARGIHSLNSRARTRECVAHRSLAAPSKHEPLTSGTVTKIGKVVARAAFLIAGKLSRSERTSQAVIALLFAREHKKVGSFGVCHAILWRGQTQREFGAKGRADSGCTRAHGGAVEGCSSLCHAHNAVKTVVVGESKRIETEPSGLLKQRLRARSAVKKAESRVRVQLGVGHSLCGRIAGFCLNGIWLRCWRTIGLAFIAPRWTVPAICTNGSGAGPA